MPAQTVGFVVKGMAKGNTLDRESERAEAGVSVGKCVHSIT